MRVDRIQRTESLFVAKLPSVKIQPGDRLYVRDTSERLKEFERLLGATLYNAGEGEAPVSDEAPLSSEGQQLAEVVVTRGSPLHHRSLDSALFTTRYRLVRLFRLVFLSFQLFQLFSQPQRVGFVSFFHLGDLLFDRRLNLLFRQWN